jgi:hypothetical protein
MLCFTVTLASLAFLLVNAQRGAVSDRIRNPEVTGAPRPVTYLFGISDSTWMAIGQLGTLTSMIIFAVVCVNGWRRDPRKPVLLMAIVTSSLVWLDPVMNWAVYAAYNPNLWHLPEDWPWYRCHRPWSR